MKKILILLLFFSFSFNRILFKEHLPCGKEKPVVEKDCSKYGTDSGFVCCYIKKLNSINNPICSLISYKEIDEIYHVHGKSNVMVEEINGETKEYIFSCGNNSKYIKNLSIFLLLLIFYYI